VRAVKKTLVTLLISAAATIVTPGLSAERMKPPIGEFFVGGRGAESAHAVLEMEDGDIVVAGVATDNGANKRYGWAIRINRDGNIKWQYKKRARHWARFDAIVRGRGGQIVLCGLQRNSATAEPRTHLVSLDGDGDVRWDSTLRTGRSQSPRILLKDKKGFVLVSSEPGKTPRARDTVKLRLLNHQGTVLKQRRPLKKIGATINFISQATDEAGYWAAGQVQITDNLSTSAIWFIDRKFLVRTEKKLPSEAGIAFGVFPSDGDRIVTSWRATQKAEKRGSEIVAQSLDANMKEKWEWSSDHLSDELPVASLITRRGNILIASQSIAGAEVPSDVWLSLISPDGKRIWRRKYGGPANDTLTAIAERDDGGFLAVGTSETYDQRKGDFWILDLDPDGLKPNRSQLVGMPAS
jgi:hypothetical protein